MKKSCLLVLLFLFSSYASFSQQLEMSFDPATNEYALDLIKKGVRMVFVYETIYKDEKQTPDYYVIWRDDRGNDYLHKNNEKDVVTLTKQDLNNFWEFVTANVKTMKTEPAMQFTFKDGKKEYAMENDDEGHVYFKTFVNDETAQMWINHYDFLAFDTIEGKKVNNIYFEDNQNLFSKRSVDMVQDMLLRIKK